MKNVLLIPLSALLFSGCFQQIAVSSLGGIMQTGFDVINQEQDLELADRSIASNLKLIETILEKDPDNTRYLLLASIGYSSYALGFVEDDSMDRARLFYDRAKRFGLRILRQHKQLAGVDSLGIREFKGALAPLSKEDVPAVFWTAVAWGSLIRSDLSNSAGIAELPKVEALTQFVLEKDPSFFYGGADFFLGTLYASRSNMLGGDTARARKYFEDCLKINGGKFLMTYIYYAQTYAYQTQDKELYERCLTKVDTTSINILPESRLSNAIAKKKAKLLRSKIEEIF
jgi:tetratricopeptide (TPR) repeat protein